MIILRIFFSLTCFLLFFTAPLGGQDNAPKTVFWEISGKDSGENSYLFGTIHVLPKKQFKAFPEADKALKSSDLLILEMKIDVPLKVQINWAKKLMLEDDMKISDYMQEEKFALLRSYALDSLGIKPFMFNNYLKLKPFAFYSALIPHAIGKKIEGYDLHFSDISKKKKIPVYGLESFEFQLGIFDSIPNEKQLDMFFEEIPDLKKEMEEMIEIYCEQDIYKMASALKEEGGEYGELEEELLILRNQNWIAQLDTILPYKKCFIAVGAAHLAGENGLINLLRQKGYRVNAIILKPEDT